MNRGDTCGVVEKCCRGRRELTRTVQSVLLSPADLHHPRVYQGCCIIRHIYLPFSETLALLQPVANVTRMLSPMLTWSLLRSIVPSAA